MEEQPVYNFEHDPSVAELAVTKRSYLEARPEASYEYIATSALVLNASTASEPHILLLQRAASDTNPNKWEPPGGAVDDEDESILHAVSRELWEETGLQTARIEGPIGKPHFFTRSNGGKVCRINLAVHAATGTGGALAVRLDPKEHQRYIWATESEVRAGIAGSVKLDFVREEVKQTVLLTFMHFSKK